MSIYGMQCTILLHCGYCELPSLLLDIRAGLEPAGQLTNPSSLLQHAGVHNSDV